jgi:hypothetical protein
MCTLHLIEGLSLLFCSNARYSYQKYEGLQEPDAELPQTTVGLFSIIFINDSRPKYHSYQEKHMGLL